MSGGAVRVAVLMTEAFATVGGIQLVNGNIIRAIAEHPGLEAETFSLHDGEPDRRYIGEQAFHGYRGDSARFVMAVCWAFLTRRYDLLFVTHRNLFPLALFWKAVTGRPYVLIGYGVEIWNRQAPLYRLALMGARITLAISQFTKEQLCRSNGIPLERAQVIELSVQAMAEEDGAPPSPNDGPPLLMTVGRVASGEQYKGQDTVIRAMPKILQSYPGACYAIAGGGDDLPRLRELARDKGVEAQVDFLGQISDREKNELYRRATVFIMPSRGEGFGLVFLEAMGYRLPCIAGNGDASREIVRDGINGFTVDPSDPDAVAAAVLRLFADPVLRTTMGEAGRRMRDSEYSFEAFSRRLCGALLKAAGRD
jgi:phosphatidylinositol alpha-1,6-mannosyltransferase